MQQAVSISTYFLTLPVEFLRWWLVESTLTLFKILVWVLEFFNQVLGVRSLLKTFFKPWKNEYREGLVGFSIFMGMFFKGMFLFLDLLFFFLLIIAEIAILATWILLPFLTVWGFYATFFS
jgi:hypothetical protein